MIPHNAVDNAITRAIIAMGRDLGIGVVGEGVETEAQRRFLQEQGCDEAQGFFFSEALDADELGRLLISRTGLARQED